MGLIKPRKLDLTATNKAKTYAESTKNYRQSNNVEDRRGLRQFDPTETPRTKGEFTIRKEGGDPNLSVVADGSGTGRDRRDDTTPDSYSHSDLPSGKGDGSTTRKVSPEEAVDRTFNRR